MSQRRIRKPRRTTPETALKRDVAKLIPLAGARRIWLRQGLGCYPGLADWIVHHRSRVIYFEFKTPNGTLSDVQADFQKACKQDGIEYYVIRSVEDAAKVLGVKMI